MPLPPLKSLLALEAVVRHRSVSRAATELIEAGFTPILVSVRTRFPAWIAARNIADSTVPAAPCESAAS